jgi:uncharacterized protein
MHVNVREFLAEDVGYRQAFAVSGERPDLEGLTLASDLSGEFILSRLDDSLHVQGNVETVLDLVCDRCLRSFTRPVRVPFERIYRVHPIDDDLPIEGNTIDLMPLIWQELTVVQPIKQLCGRPDCTKLDTSSDDDSDSDNNLRLGDRARITKG